VTVTVLDLKATEGFLGPKISILIPVYRESDLLEPLLTDLLRDPYRFKEVLVVIDKPTETSINVVKRFQNRVAFILNGERVGKAKALNELFKRTTGEILLFLDSDLQLQANRESFMETLAREMEGVEIVDIKKSIIRSSFLARLVHYEYLASSLVSWLFSKKIGKCLGLNGAAFAIRREAFQRLGGFRRMLSEDFDLATRSFLEKLSFKYSDKVAVSIKPCSDWRSWYKQRKRWSIATGVWLKGYYRQLAGIVVSRPQVMLLSLPLMLPSLLLLPLNFLLPDVIYCQVTSLALLILASYASLALPFTFPATFGVPVAKSVLAAVLSYASFSAIYFLSAKKLGYCFNPGEFLCFYFIYAPISLLMIIIGLFRVATHNDRIDLDWKV